ncbi:MAG: hypothetical protein KKG33_02500 [candidate division Zixibacteria bacterium]|nr:hypothetical protein [candidate division Zixibacteria bacterium]MBU1470091.1 hypothetical protein [candidate division Zixibacteria bacterium]MBU2624411.1 hypothetical protein [candidate division Zixibacteria bacterium]
MKRVILSLTLALLMLGLVCPTISQADDSATPAASSASSAAAQSTPTASAETFPPETENSSLGSVLDDLLEMASSLTDLFGDDIEPPSMSGTPPGDPVISDSRPDGDDGGWDDDMK